MRFTPSWYEIWAVGFWRRGFRLRYYPLSLAFCKGVEHLKWAHTCEKYVSMTVGVTAVPTDIVLNTMA